MEVIVGSVNIDFDCLASAVAVQKLYPEAVICLSGSPEKNVRDFMETYKSTFKFVKERRIKTEQITRLILVDNNQADRMSSFSELARSGAVELHIYDHHPPSKNQLKGDKQVISPVGATTTLLVKLLKDQAVRISPLEATLFALGIYEDTGNFVHVSTTEDDLKAAAFLMTQGVDLKMLQGYLKPEDLSEEQVDLLHALMHQIEMHRVRGVEIAIATAETKTYVGEAAQLVRKIEEMHGFLALFCVMQMGEKVCIIARSTVEAVNVGKILEMMGGGGHQTAASTTIHDGTLKHQKEKLLDLLEEYVRRVPLARDIMTSPVDVVPQTQSIAQVRQRLLMMHHKYMCIINSERNLVGVVTKNDVSKAVAQGQADRSIQFCMTSPVVTAGPDASYYDLQNLMIEHKIGSVPISENGRLLGIVTRENLLNAAAQMNMHQFQATVPTEFDFDDATQRLKEWLPEDMMRVLNELGQAGNEMGMGVYLVGGFVRDMLLDRKNYDVDIVVEGDAIDYALYFSERYVGKRKNFEQFRTVILSLPRSYIEGGLKIDITTARLEHYEEPAIPPVVESSVIKHDLYRRDFTINAIAIQINPHRFGHMVDLFGGRRDLKLGIIKVLHNGSFYDDPTRMLRAIRFEQRFKFEIEKNTQQLLHTAAGDRILGKVSAQRIREEIINILSEEKPYHAIQRLGEYKLLAQIHPKIGYDEDMFCLFEEIYRILHWYHLENRHESVEPWVVYLLGLISRMRVREAKKFGKKLTWHRHVCDKFNELFTARAQVAKVLTDPQHLPNSRVHQCLKNVSTEVLLFLMAESDERVEQRIAHFISKLRDVQIQLRGSDLFEFGVEPGPMVGRILRQVLHKRLDGFIRTGREERELARQLAATYLKEQQAGTQSSQPSKAVLVE